MSLLSKYYENLQKVKAEENKRIFTQNEKSTTSSTDEKIILPSASHHPVTKFVHIANTQTERSSSPIVISMRDPCLTSQLSTRNPTLTSQLGTREPGLTSQPPAKATNVHGTITQGKQVHSPTQGHSEQPPTKGHEFQLLTQGHIFQLPSQGHGVQLPTQGHVVQQPTQGGGAQHLTQTFVGQLATRGHLVQLPTQGHLVQLLTQGLVQFTTQGNGVKHPTQGHLVQLPTQGNGVNIPTQGHLVQLPTQGHLVQLPTHGHDVKLPTQGHLVRLLTQSHGVKLPIQGHVGHLTNQCHGLQLPAQGHDVQLTTQGLVFQLPIQGHGNQLSTIGNGMQLPTEGHGVQLPTEGHGVQLLTQGHEVQLPLKWAPVKPISSSYSLRIQQYKKTKPYLKKRKTRRPKPRGISVALDEYYYGRLEGVPNYQEEKDSFRFECFHCGKVLYNNVRTMLHINRHLYPEWVVDLDTGNLAGCLKCNRDFDNPFEMQTHYDKDHLKQDNPQCRICERKFSNVHRHMETQHNICEMPYICQLCKFRSSMHSDVIHHFVTKHNRSEFLLCLLCLHVMKRPRSNGNSGNKLNYYYYHHLRGYGIQRKGCNLGCNRCKLIFRTKTELVEHRRTDHLPYQERVNEIDAKYSTPGQVEKESGNVGGVSCLNAPAVRKSMDNELVIPPGVSKLGCIECKRLVGIPDHFRKYSCCSLCRFATNCRFAYSHHVTGSHCGQLTEATSHTPNQGRMEEQFYCACGFVSNYGNLIANHLVACSKSSCSKYVCPASALEELDQDMEIKEEIESGDETNMGNKAADGCMSDNDGEVKYGYTQAFSDMVDEDKHRYSKALSDIVSEDKLKQEVKEEVAMEIIQDTEEFS